MKTFIALAVLASIAVPAAASLPQSGSWKIGNDSYHIYYADLDMNSSSGRAVFLARAEKAAARLCNEPLKIDEQSCVAATIASLPGANVQLALAERNAVRLAAR